jgi:SAM-dependent methyltransferase
VPGLRHTLAPPPRGSRRLEIGSGRYPTAGHLHVDCDPGAPDVELLCAADAVPLPAGWADEILSVHVIEHVPADTLQHVLRSWHDLLAPGGRLEVHTPNGAALGRVVADPDVDRTTFWAAQSATFGYDLHPSDAIGPRSLARTADHSFILSGPILVGLLEEAGFTDIAPLDDASACRHQIAWRDLVPDFCLELVARKPG